MVLLHMRSEVRFEKGRREQRKSALAQSINDDASGFCGAYVVDLI